MLDLVREMRPPFSPESVVEDFSQTLAAYRVGRVHGDRYAGEWPREQFKKRGVDYLPSDKVKSDIYLAALPLLNSGKVQLLDNKRLVQQLHGLERRTARGGRIPSIMLRTGKTTSPTVSAAPSCLRAITRRR